MTFDRRTFPMLHDRLYAKDRGYANWYDGPYKQWLADVERTGRGCSIRNATGDVAEILLYDEIGWFGITAGDFAGQLAAVTAPEILVAINSPGGDVFDGVAIYNALRAHPARVTTRVDSMAGSIASIVAQAGEQRQMMSGSQMVIHEAWGLVIGPAADMRATADILDRQSDNLATIYAERTGKDAKHFRSLMAENNHWMTAEETVSEGLADEVLKPSAKAQVAFAKTFNDELREAMDVVSATLESAERVAALRAEKGKTLSGVNRDDLDEIAASMDRLKALLIPESTSDDHTAEFQAEYLRFIATSQEMAS